MTHDAAERIRREEGLDRPVRVTMPQWSFPRTDLPRETICRQLALAIRDEVMDHHADRADYLRRTVACFRLAASGVRDEAQIHPHVLLGIQRHHCEHRRDRR
ncbi:hypothetical protein [Elioraea sp.]|uniref:hypothetical protein n=1 Tax=Elioraea sp. TaxID=2185103 RepID=UPI0038D0C55D